jgi:hypothetical protein
MGHNSPFPLPPDLAAIFQSQGMRKGAVFSPDGKSFAVLQAADMEGKNSK